MTSFKKNFDCALGVMHSASIKPAAPLLACVIRRVFFCPNAAACRIGGPA